MARSVSPLGGEPPRGTLDSGVATGRTTIARLSANAFNRAFPDCLRLALGALLLSLGIVAGWLTAADRYSFADFADLYYSGDAIAVLAWIKAYSTGEIWPFFPKEIASLGAPFGGNWTDFPAEDFIYFTAGLLAKVFGLLIGASVFVMCLHVLAGLSFFIVGRTLGYRATVVFAGALLFGLAPCGFARNLPHLTLTAYWHIPLALFAVKWAAGQVNPTDGSSNVQRALAISGAVLAGFLNPYYLAAFLWLGACVMVGSFVAGRREAGRAMLLLLGLSIGAYLLQSLDSLWIAARYGGNSEVLGRRLIEQDAHGLRLPDLLFPYWHRSEFVQSWSRRLYADLSFSRGEGVLSYIGIISCVSLMLLLVTGTARTLAKRVDAVSEWYWFAVLTIGFAIVGGVNYFIGSLGMVYLRATTRFSIVIMAIALLWACESVSRLRGRWIGPVIATAMIAIGVWDQVIPRSILAISSQARTDAQFIAALESMLPKGAMVLQLPVQAFPESGPVHHMGDYEHLRLYLHSISLRFSYGTIHGRSDFEWQKALNALPAEDLVARATEYGFAAIYIDRRGYPDAAAELEGKLTAQLGAPIVKNAGRLAYRLPTPAHPHLPPLVPIVEYSGFHRGERSAEHSWSWARGATASLILKRPYRAFGVGTLVDYEMTFGVRSGNPGNVHIFVDEELKAISPPGQFVKMALPFHADARSLRVDLRNDVEKLPAADGGGWNDNTPDTWPDWVQIQFGNRTAINRVTVYTLQDDYANAVEPDDALTFTRYGVTDFTIEGWDGARWLQLGAVQDNNLVKRTVVFAPVLTDTIRVVVNKGLAGYSRITEVEAWTPGGSPPTNVALSSAGATASASSTFGPRYRPSTIIDGERAGRNWASDSQKWLSIQVSDVQVRETSRRGQELP